MNEFYNNNFEDNIHTSKQYTCTTAAVAKKKQLILILFDQRGQNVVVIIQMQTSRLNCVTLKWARERRTRMRLDTIWTKRYTCTHSMQENTNHTSNTPWHYSVHSHKYRHCEYKLIQTHMPREKKKHTKVIEVKWKKLTNTHTFAKCFVLSFILHHSSPEYRVNVIILVSGMTRIASNSLVNDTHERLARIASAFVWVNFIMFMIHICDQHICSAFRLPLTEWMWKQAESKMNTHRKWDERKNKRNRTSNKHNKKTE